VHSLNDGGLSYFGGEIRFDQGPWQINGDTGIKDELESINGLPRAIPLFTEVTAPGNNAMYTIVEFVGIRIMDVKLAGGDKHVYIQPAPFIDPSAIYGYPRAGQFFNLGFRAGVWLSPEKIVAD